MIVPDRTEFAKEVEEFLGGYVVAQVLDEERSGEEMLAWSSRRVYVCIVRTYRLTSGASLELRLISRCAGCN
jgi:hypothetical protein